MKFFIQKNAKEDPYFLFSHISLINKKYKKKTVMGMNNNF